MEVKLIQHTQNPIDVMWAAARTCYASESPIDMWDSIYDYSKYFMQTENIISVKIDKNAASELENEKEKRWKLIQHVLDSGHQSIAEHVYFTFAIEGITRACSHQLVRHRAGIVFSQQSQRYVNLNTGFDYEIPKSIQENEELCDEFKTLMRNIQNFYNRAILCDIKAEDARSVLPNACTTNITFSVNYRELIHLCNLRLCTRAQLEIRNLFKKIVTEVKQVDERLIRYLVPQCEIYGFCMEKQSCGRYPKLDDIKTKRWIPNYGKAEE